MEVSDFEIILIVVTFFLKHVKKLVLKCVNKNEKPNIAYSGAAIKGLISQFNGRVVRPRTVFPISVTQILHLSQSEACNLM